jgi:hypothetical protein
MYGILFSTVSAYLRHTDVLYCSILLHRTDLTLCFAFMLSLCNMGYYSLVVLVMADHHTTNFRQQECSRQPQTTNQTVP